MSIDDLRWLMGLNVVLAVWLGMLANSWKGRHMYGWMIIGLFTSVAGLVLLVLVKKLPTSPRDDKHVNGFAPTDSYGH